MRESRVRLTLEVQGESKKNLEELASRHGSQANVFRKGLALLFAMEKAKEEGLHVGAYKQLPDGSYIEREFIFPR